QVRVERDCSRICQPAPKLMRQAAQAEPPLSSTRLSTLWGLVAAAGGPLLLCRGLLVGSGGYQLYIDSALPASAVLMRGVCNQSLSLWSTANLGGRVLYPAEYLVCTPITAALDLHVPAWVISRWIPIACLILAS